MLPAIGDGTGPVRNGILVPPGNRLRKSDIVHRPDISQMNQRVPLRRINSA